jgi:hypothetical protein
MVSPMAERPGEREVGAARMQRSWDFAILARGNPGQGGHQGETDMTIRQLLAVGLRLFALWLCIDALQLFTMTRTLMTGMGVTEHSMLAGFYVVAAMLLVAVFLWFACASLAGALLGGLGKNVPVGLSAFDLLVVGCIVLGLLWLKESLLPLVTLLFRTMTEGAATGESVISALDPSHKVSLVIDVLEVLVGVFFLCRPRHIASFLMRLPDGSATPASRPVADEGADGIS